MPLIQWVQQNLTSEAQTINVLSADLGLSAGTPAVVNAAPPVVVETPAARRPNLLVRALELPLPPEMTNAQGIHQSDIIIRFALKAALADMRANPWLLDYCFASLAQDPLTIREYGEQNIQAAKDWFLKSDIPIISVSSPDELKPLAITIALVDSTEVTPEATLGDIHSEPLEENDGVWPILTGPLTPKSYVPGTGVITMAQPLPGDLVLEEGMFIGDFGGRAHEVLEVIDDTSFRISPYVVADFRNSVIRPARPAFVTGVESSSFRETYSIGIHTPGEPQKLLWLHSIIVFCLLRYKQALLEARGFERSTFQSSEFNRESQFDTELVYGRYIRLSGHVRHYWPKNVSQKIGAVRVQPLRVSVGVTRDNGSSPGDVRVADAGLDPNSQTWVGNKDIVDQQRKK